MSSMPGKIILHDISGAPLEGWAFVSKGWLACSCGYRQVLPIDGVHPGRELHRHCCKKCANVGIDIDSALVLGASECLTNSVFRQEVYQLDGMEGNFFVARHMTLTLNLQPAHETLYGIALPDLQLVECDDMGRTLHSQEISLFDERLIRDVASNWTCIENQTASSLRWDMPRASHLPGFVVAWLLFRLHEAVNRLLKHATHNKPFERLLAHLAIPALKDEPTAILGVEETLLVGASGCARFDRFCCEKVLVRHRTKGVRRALFGMLAKAAEQRSSFDIRWVTLLDQVFTDPNHMVALLSQPEKIQPVLQLDSRGREILKALLKTAIEEHSEQVIVRAILQYGTNYWGIKTLNDTLQMWSMLESKTCIDYRGTLGQLHDRLVEQFWRPEQIAVTPSDPFQYVKPWRHFEGCSNGLRFRLPRSPQELAQWGAMGKNCLASYIPSVNNHVTIILGVEQGGQWRYFCETSPAGELIQILGFENKPAPTEIEKSVRDYLDRRASELDCER